MQIALEVQQSGCTRLTADIDAFVGVGEAVELGSGALGVGTHVFKVEPVSDIDNALEVNALGDAVNAVAGRTPDRVLKTIPGSAGASGGEVVHGLAGSAQNVGDRVLMVKHDTGEVSINTVVNVDHVTLAVKGGILNSAASNDVASNGESSGNIVPSRLSNDINVGSRGEEFVEGCVQDACHLLKGIAGKTTADVKGS